MIVIFNNFYLRVLMSSTMVTFTSVLGRVPQFPPRLVSFRVQRSVIRLLIIISITSPITRSTINPTRIKLRISSNCTSERVLCHVNQDLISTLKGHVGRLTGFPITFIIILTNRSVNSTGRSRHRWNSSPVVCNGSSGRRSHGRRR